MTKEYFLKDYYCEVTDNHNDINLIINTKIYHRVNKKIVAAVSTTFDIYQANEWIIDSQSQISLIPWNGNSIKDRVKREQLFYFAQRIPIDNYFPLDEEINIDDMYI